MRLTLAAKWLLTPLCALTGCLAAGPCFSQTPPQLPPVEVKASRLVPLTSPTPTKTSAPSTPDLDANEPRSIVDGTFSDGFVAPSADYASVVQYTPGVLVLSPNGPGFSDAKISFRGFQDGFYTITFDGIPIGDTNDATHHSTSYFPPQFIGQTVVDRSPGNASRIGFATFGGAIDLRSKQSNAASMSASASIASRNTHSWSGELARAPLSTAHETHILLQGQQVESDGFQSNAPFRRANLLLKATQQVTPSVLVTALATLGITHSASPTGITQAQHDRFGPDYGLSSDATKGSFVGYNQRHRFADLAYVGAEVDLGQYGRLENKLYTTGYRYGPDYYGDTTETKKAGNPFAAPGNQDVVGTYRRNRWRTFGDVLKVRQQVGASTLESGVWFDQSRTSRFRQAVDFTLGNQPVAPVGQPLRAIDYNSSAVSRTVQAFIDADTALSSTVRVVTGMKYAFFRQAIDERPDRANFSSEVRTGGQYRAYLPSVALHVTPHAGASYYLQYATGVQMPPTSLFDVAHNGAIGTLPAAQRTKSVQFGSVLAYPGYNLGWDMYQVHFANAITSFVDNAGETIYSNRGGATYRGIEAESTVKLGAGFSAYLNATLNHARALSDGSQLAYVPTTTQTASLLYDRGTGQAGLITRRIGRYYAGLGSSSGSAFAVSSYFLADMVGSVTMRLPGNVGESIRLQAGVNNLFNRRNLIDVFPGAVTTYNYQPGRNLFVSATVSF